MLTASGIKKIRQQAAANQLEVEDILGLAAVGDRSAISLLQELKHEHQWSESGFNDEGNRIVPFARWADVVCAYLDGGYDRLVALAVENLPGTTAISFSAAVLETLKTSQSVDALLRISESITPLDRDSIGAAITLAEKFNLILSFKNAPQVDPQTANTVCSFLHNCLAHDLTQPQRSTIVCALRGVGNEESIDIIKALPRFEYPYDGLEGKVVRTIRKRLKALANA